MESNTPPSSLLKAEQLDMSSQPSTLRRKAADVFCESIFSSRNPFEADTFEFSDHRVPTGVLRIGGNSAEASLGVVEEKKEEVGTVEEKDDKKDEGVVRVDVKSPTDAKIPSRQIVALSSETASRVSTLQRKTEELFSGSAYPSNPFDAGEDEFAEASPVVRTTTLRKKMDKLSFGSGVSSNPFEPDEDDLEKSSPARAVRPSTLRRKTDELFSGSGYSSNPFDPDEDEQIELPPVGTARDISSHSLRVTPIKRAGINISTSRVSVEAGIEQTADEKYMAVKLLPKQYVEAQKDTSTTNPRFSTLKCESSEPLAQQGHSSTGMWTADNEDFVQKLETMRLNPSQRIRGNCLKLLRSSTSSKATSPLHHAAKDKENIPASQQDSSFSRVQHGPFASTGNSLSRSKRALPLGSIFDSPNGTSKDSTTGADDCGPVLSIWDAVEDEFDRWPDKQDLANAVKSFTIQRGTFHGTSRSKRGTISPKRPQHLHAPPAIDEEISHSIPPLRGADLTEQEHSDFMHELLDKNCGNPHGLDAHDEVMQQFYHRSTALPHSYPAGHMHVLNHKSYQANEDTIVQYALPRLPDAVATVLYLTSPKCLSDFLDPEIKVFEWRRDGNCLMIRREGTHVIVGTYHNFGTCYIWTYFVQSTISDTGAWKESYAGVTQICTPISARGVEFEDMVEGEGLQGVDPKDEKYALHMGRLLGRFLLEWSVWDFRAWRRWVVEWEADGVVVNAREWAYEALRMARDEDE